MTTYTIHENAGPTTEIDLQSTGITTNQLSSLVFAYPPVSITEKLQPFHSP